MFTYEVSAQIKSNLNNPRDGYGVLKAVHFLIDVYSAGFLSGYYADNDNPYYWDTPGFDAWEIGNSHGNSFRFSRYFSVKRPPEIKPYTLETVMWT